MLRTQRTQQSTERRGIAATELAICLPMLLLFLMGILESCSMIFLKQSLAVAAYEGSHQALVADATAADVITTCNQILSDRGIEGTTVTVIPNNIESLAAGEFFEINVSASADDNKVVPLSFFGGLTIESSAFFMKEL